MLTWSPPSQARGEQQCPLDMRPPRQLSGHPVHLPASGRPFAPGRHGGTGVAAGNVTVWNAALLSPAERASGSHRAPASTWARGQSRGASRNWPPSRP